MCKVRGKTKFLNEPYMSYGEEKTEVLTKKFAIYTISISFHPSWDQLLPQLISAHPSSP